MKITVYTINDCQFSVQEKEYLKSLNLPFEEKNLEQNRDFLTEMLAVSNNFAGTPVTKVEKDDGQIVVLKGFTKEEFDKALGTPAGAAVPPQTVNANNFGAPMAPTIEQPAPVTTMPAENTMASMTPQAPVQPMSTEPAMPAPAQPVQAADINDTLSKLSNAMGTMPAVTEPPPITTPSIDTTIVPPMQPVVPDMTMQQPPVQQPAPVATAPTTLDNPALNNILNNLEQKAGDNNVVPQQPAPTVPGTPSTNNPLS